MSLMWSLIRKDIKSFFLSPLFYLVAFICTLFWTPVYIYSFGVFLTQTLSVLGSQGEFIPYQERVVEEFVALINIMLILTVNSITMKLISEEKKNHTYELLMTSPISSWQIVLSKYIAGCCVTFILVGIAALYPLTTSLLGVVDWGPLFSAFLGLFLFSCVYVAVGLLASSLSSSVLISFILALILNLGLWFLGLGSEIFESGPLNSFFTAVNFETISKDFSYGLIRLPAVVLLSSLVVFCLVAVERVIESSRWP